MDNATITEYVVYDNGTRHKVEQVISNPDSDYTFVVVRDGDGNVRSMLLDTVVIVQSEWQ